MGFYKRIIFKSNDTRLKVSQKARERKHTRGLGSFEGLAALLSHHGVDADHVLSQWVEALENCCGLGAIHKHLMQRG